MTVILLYLKSKIIFYDVYQFWGMHLVSWFTWMIFICWNFATPYDLPGQRRRKDLPLDILQKRFSSGKLRTMNTINGIGLMIRFILTVGRIWQAT